MFYQMYVGYDLYSCVCKIVKYIYNRETIAASNYEIHQMSFIPHFPSMQLT